MIPRYPYVAMVVTGCLHCVLGVAGCMTAIAGLTLGTSINGYCAGALIVGVWILMVGALGIAVGVQMIKYVKIRQNALLVRGPAISADWERLADEKIRQLKFAYMVTAIVSASLFCLVASGLNTGILIVGADREIGNHGDDYFSIAGVGLSIAFLEFILAIVSSSICCCCFPTTSNITHIVQAPIQQMVSTVTGQSTLQYQSPPSAIMEYQQTPNHTMQYQTLGFEAVSSQPPAYQQDADLTKPQ